MSDHSGDMPIMTAHNDTLARIMQRHGISQLELATESQLSEPTISRVINGKRVVTPEIIRALWRLTLDTQIISMLTGMSEFSIIRSRDSSLTPEQAECLMVRALGQLMSSYATTPRTDDERAARVQLIDEAINAVLTFRAKVTGSCPAHASANTTQAHRAYRTIQHESHLIDQVA